MVNQVFYFQLTAYLDDDVNGEIDPSVDVYTNTATLNPGLVEVQFIFTCGEDVFIADLA